MLSHHSSNKKVTKTWGCGLKTTSCLSLHLASVTSRPPPPCCHYEVLCYHSAEQLESKISETMNQKRNLPSSETDHLKCFITATECWQTLSKLSETSRRVLGWSSCDPKSELGRREWLSSPTQGCDMGTQGTDRGCLSWLVGAWNLRHSLLQYDWGLQSNKQTSSFTWQVHTLSH